MYKLLNLFHKYCKYKRCNRYKIKQKHSGSEENSFESAAVWNRPLNLFNFKCFYIYTKHDYPGKNH